MSDQIQAVAPVAKTRAPKIETRAFVTAWERACKADGCVKDVVAELYPNCPTDKVKSRIGTVQTRASGLRKKGVPLSRFSGGGGRKVDVSDANAILADILGLNLQEFAELQAKRAAEDKAAAEAKAAKAAAKAAE